MANGPVEFQLPMFFSFSLVAFERLIALLWLVNDYMKRFEVNESSFQYAVRMVYAPYWLGHAFFVLFEVGWECLVFLYSLPFFLSFLLAENETSRRIVGGVYGGITSAVGKSGIYLFFSKFIGDDTKKGVSEIMGTGMKDNVISMWVANNDAKEWDFENYHMGDEGVTQLCKAIVAHKSRVERLNLTSNNVVKRALVTRQYP